MSIYAPIAAAVKAGTLFPFPASKLGFPQLRHVALAPKVNDLLFAGTWDEDWNTRRVHLQLELEWFVDGRDISVALPNENDPYEDKPDANFRLLYKWHDEVWEIRSKMQPQIRIFGSFATPDYFVALLWEFRCKLGDPPWKECATCKEVWNRLFPNHPPFTGKTIHDYITENAFPC